MKKLYSVLIFLNILFAVPINAGFITGLQWIITCGMPTFSGLIGIQKIIKHHFSKQQPSDPEAPESVQNYVRNELKPILKNAQDLKVLIRPDHSAWDFSTNTFDHIHLGLNNETKKTVLEELLEKKSLSEEEQLALSKINFALHHEASHIKNKDIYKDGVFSILIPAITWMMFKKIQRNMNNSMPRLASSLVKIPLTVGLFAINLALCQMYERYREQKADDMVANKKELLQGGIAMMNGYIKRDSKLKEFIDSEIQLLPVPTQKKARILTNLICSFIKSEHPASEVRLAKLEERLKKLEQ